jgi:ATP-dependent RNA helicase TDRD9
MGESSITLPNCKVVIDFCLSRKNFANKIKGTSKFETRLASKANLTQRSGRVGRVSDGIVYRLITKS